MTATRTDILEWLEQGKRMKATHVIIAVDTFDYANFPVYVMPGQDARKQADTVNLGTMQRVEEVYDLSKPLQPQLNEHRSFNF